MKKPKANMLVYAALALILIFGALLAFFLYSGPFYAYDDVSYINYAHQMLVGGFNIEEGPYAFGFLLPAIYALSFFIFGQYLFASSLPALIAYFSLIVLVFLIGRELLDNAFALLAAFLMAASPYVVGYATRVLPDMFTGLFATAALYLFIIAHRSKSSRLLYFIAGALAALTIYVKLIGFIFILALAIASLFVVGTKKKHGLPRKTSAPTAVVPQSASDFACLISGIIVFLLLYFSMVYLATGNPLYTLTNYGKFQSTQSPSNLTLNSESFFALFADYTGAQIFAPVPLPEVSLFGILPIWCLLGTYFAILRKNRGMLFIAVLFWIALLYSFFGSSQIGAYSPFWVDGRYLILVSAPISLLAAYGIFDIVNMFRLIFGNRAYLVMFITAAVTLASFISPYLGLYGYNFTVSSQIPTFSAILSAIRGSGLAPSPRVFVSSGSTTEFLNFLSGYGGEYNIAVMQGVCTKSYSGSMLLAFYNAPVPYINSTREAIASWVGENCTMARLASFVNNGSNSAYTNYYGYGINATLYSIK